MRRIVGITILAVMGVAVARAQQIFMLDTSVATITFETKHLGVIPVNGTFRALSGVITVSENSSSIADIELLIRAASITTSNLDRDKTIRGPGFLAVDRFPLITFRLRTPVHVDAGRLTGLITIKDTTRPLDVTFRSRDFATRHWTLTGSAELSRSAYDLHFESMDDLVADKITISFEVKPRLR